MPKLLDSDSEDSGDERLTINKNYAERYVNWREKEEFQKLKDKYGENILSEASELSGSESDSDENPTDEEEYQEQLGQRIFDEKFLKVYGALKRKDPSIYDEKIKFYDESDQVPVPTKAKAEGDPKLTLGEYHVKLVTERKGVTEEDLDDYNDRLDEKKPEGYYEEMGAIQNEFRKVLNESDDEELITGIKQTTATSDKLKSDADISYLQNYWADTKNIDERDKFLRDYIVKKKYLEPGTSSLKPKRSFAVQQDSSSEEEEEAVKPEAAVAKHHFEELGGGEIKRFPRIKDSARDLPEQETRATRRQVLKERKKKEKEEDLKRFSELKKKDIDNRLKKLQEISGNDKILEKELNIDALIDDDKDFDPDKYDQKMEALFGDNYYGDVEEDKPEFEFMPGIDDDIEEEARAREEQLKGLVEGDASSDEEDDDEESGARRKNKKQRKRKEKRINLSKLDSLPIYEDIIGGDLPTRFKYRTVHSNDFGLSTDELLYADDKELNKWASLKKATQYRQDHEEEYDRKAYEQKRNNVGLKKKILQSLFKEDKDKTEQEEDQGDEPAPTEGEQTKKKHRRSKKKKPQIEPVASKGSESVAEDRGKKPSRKRKPKRKNQEADKETVTMDRLKAYGLSNKEIKRRKLRK